MGTPDRFASLTVVTGFVPDGLKLGPLKAIPSIQLLGSKDDSKHPDLVCQRLEDAGAHAELQILKGSKHNTVGQHIDKAQFWEWLEGAQKRCAAKAPSAATAVAQADKEPEVGATAMTRNEGTVVHNADADASNGRPGAMGDEKVAWNEGDDAPNDEKIQAKAKTRRKYATKRRGNAQAVCNES